MLILKVYHSLLLTYISGVSYLARISSLKELDLSYCTLDDEILPHLIKLRYLETLVLKYVLDIISIGNLTDLFCEVTLRSR